MNHDFAHCWDYEMGVCPNGCFRAVLTEDLKNWSHPVTYAKIKGTDACPLTNPQPKRTHGDKIRSSTDVELAKLLTEAECPSDFGGTEKCKDPPPHTSLDSILCRECWLDWLRKEADT